jgi:hypothetical protein
MAYIVINTKTLQCLCQSVPVDFRCYDYWEDTRFSPWQGRFPLGNVRSFDSIYRASMECSKHTNCEVARYHPCMNRIERL